MRSESLHLRLDNFDEQIWWREVQRTGPKWKAAGRRRGLVLAAIAKTQQNLFFKRSRTSQRALDPKSCDNIKPSRAHSFALKYQMVIPS